MKTKTILLGMLFLITSCVQKGYKRVVVVTLDVSKVKNIQTVGLRGNGKPLSWDADYPMQEVVKNRLYTTTIVTQTGSLFAEGKCTVNGSFELQNKPNRRITFDTKNDTTYVQFTFDKE